jgi:mono/diheme cytochrome c family protein
MMLSIPATWTVLLLTLLASGATPAAQERGAQLARSLGCGACHAGMPGVSAIREAAPRLGEGGASVPAAFAFSYLADPTPRRTGIEPARMPDFRLSEEERLALALYLADGPGEEGAAQETGEIAQALERFPHVTAREGELLFKGLGCAGCHGIEEPLPVGPDLSTSGLRLQDEWVRSFLAAPGTVRPAGTHPGTGSRMPDFRLSPEEVSDLSTFLASRDQGVPPSGEAGPSLTPWGERRAETYLTDRLSCLGCHQWKGEGGRLAPALDHVASRLTPEAIRSTVLHPEELVGWSVMPPSRFRADILEEVASFLQVGSDGARAVASEPETLPWAERQAFLREFTRSPGEGGVASPAGEGVYVRYCAACHGSSGDGQGFNAPYLPASPTVHADSARMAVRPDDTLYDGIAAGGWVLDRSHRMPAFGRLLTPAQIRDAVAYIRTLCRCGQPSWAADGGTGR